MNQESYHPLEEVLRLIAREAPRPWYPREFIRQSGADPDQVSSLLEYLTLEGLIDKVPGRSLESGAGVVLTPLGEKVVADPDLMDRLLRREVLVPDDPGAMIRQQLRNAGTPYITYALIAVNVAVFLLEHFNRPLGRWMLDAGRAVDTEVLAGRWWTLLTSLFLHGGMLHLGCNMLSLYSLGTFVEQAWGRWRFLVIYFVAGWGGSCLALAFQPSGVGLIGASGAICGLLGAVGVWFLLYGRYLPPGAGRRGMGQVLFSILFIVVLSVAIEQGVKNVRISHMAHLGGGIAGVIAALILHLQRFGVPALHLRNTTFRWGVAGLLLLLVPMASYLQMQTAWARRAVVRDEDRKDRDKGKKEEVKKEEVKKKKDKGKEEPPAGVAGPFLRHYAEPVSETADALLKTAEDVPVNLEKAKADANTRKTLREQFATHKKTLTQLQDELEKKQYDDERIEEGRKEAVKLLRQGLELCDVAVAYLREPTAQGRESFKNGFEQVDDLAHEFKQRRKKLREL